MYLFLIGWRRGVEAISKPAVADRLETRLGEESCAAILPAR
jgi:hypothetical protein